MARTCNGGKYQIRGRSDKRVDDDDGDMNTSSRETSNRVFEIFFLSPPPLEGENVIVLDPLYPVSRQIANVLPVQQGRTYDCENGSYRATCARWKHVVTDG